MPTLPFVGRQLELASLRETCAEAGAALVVGGPGLGKSRLIAELAADPDLICVVGVGAPELQSSPYAVFRTLALQWGRLLDPQSLGWSDNQLQNLGPLFPALLGAGPSDDHSSEERRQGLWLSLVRYFDALVASQSRPLVLVVEDLHAADDSSLSLFAWLSSQPLDIAMIATSRPEAPEPVAKLSTIGLRPLGLTAIEAIQQGTDSTSTDAETLLGLTGGVPLRLHEWVLGASLGGSAHAHGALLERVLEGCDSSTVDALRLAAVFPGRIDAYVLASVLTVSESDAVEALADAETRGVMTQHRDGTWSFHHDSLRTSLLDSLDRQQRRTCERRLVDGLRNELVGRPEMLGHLAAIATDLGDNRVEAAELHVAAGQYAIGQLAPVTAREHFVAAVELAERTNRDDLVLQANLSLGLVLAALSETDAPEVLAKVYPLAEARGDSNSFARAALAEPVGLGHIGVSMVTNHLSVARLRSAGSKAIDPSLRARVLAALAVQQHSSLTEYEYFSLIDEAQAIATTVADPSLDGQILAARVGARRAIGAADDARADVQRALDRLEPFDPNALPMVDLAVMLACRSGDLGAAEDLLRRYENEFAPLPVVARWSVLRARTAIAFARGSVEMARTLSLEALHATSGTRLDVVALEHFAFQIAAMLRERRKMPDARPTIETWVAEHPAYAAFRASRAWLYADLGDLAAARSDLEVFFAQDLVELRGRIEGPVAISMALCAAFVIDGADVENWCVQGYELLRPLADEWLIVGQGSLIEGPVVRVMALASSVLGETERALEENAEAQRRAQESGALLFVWHALRDRGLMLRRAGRFSEASEVLEDVISRYRSAGLSQQADWLEDERRAMVSSSAVSAPSGVATPTPDDQETARTSGEFRRDNDVWHVALGDEVMICRHLKGMAMIAALLGAPDRPIAASALAVVGDGATLTAEHAAIRTESAQTLVDDEAVEAYRRRSDEIVDQLDRADRRGDVVASTQLQAELDEITRELASAHGLGGRRRAMTSEDERSRVRVNKAIRSSIRRIGEQAPSVALHLERSIDTGLFCSYRPDPLRRVDWTLR